MLLAALVLHERIHRQRLFISVNTVKKYLSRVYAKVDVDGRAELAATSNSTP